jgi:hypothetical protein
LLAVDDIVNQNALLLAFVEENGREWVVSQNALNELGTIALVPNRLALEAGLQVQVPMFVKVLEVEDALGGCFVGDGGVSEHKPFRRLALANSRALLRWLKCGRIHSIALVAVGAQELASAVEGAEPNGVRAKGEATMSGTVTSSSRGKGGWLL